MQNSITPQAIVVTITSILQQHNNSGTALKVAVTAAEEIAAVVVVVVGADILEEDQLEERSREGKGKQGGAFLGWKLVYFVAPPSYSSFSFLLGQAALHYKGAESQGTEIWRSAN